MDQDFLVLATRYSLERLRVSTINFDRDYRRGEDGSFSLVSEKAVIRVLGKETKVAIGEGTKFSTYEAAFEATKKYWSEYYKNIRSKRSPAQQQAEAKRQKRYREDRKRARIEQKRQQ